MCIMGILKKILSCIEYVIGDYKNRKFLDLTYKLYGKKYIYRLKLDHKPVMLRNIKIFNEFEEDITHLISPYMGINYDFHKTSYCPNDFGWDELHFHEDGNILSFKNLEIIKYE